MEIDKLLKAGFIREVNHPEWLANPVMVRKANGKWRMCIDFTDLNKTCPKDVTAPDLINSNKMLFIASLFIFAIWALCYNLNPPISSENPKLV